MSTSSIYLLVVKQLTPGSESLDVAVYIEVHPDRYKWIALTNTTLGRFHGHDQLLHHLDLAAGDLPRHRHQSPVPGQRGLPVVVDDGLLLVTAVLVISLGRLATSSVACASSTWASSSSRWRRSSWRSTPTTAAGGAIWLVLWRLVQGVGGAMFFANSSAILVDAFPTDQRGHGHGRQPGRRDRWLLRRTDRRSASSRSSTGGSSFGSRSPLASSARCGVTRACAITACARRPDRLVGQPHLRRRSDLAAGGHRLRDRTLRRALHGLDVSAGARRPSPSPWCCSAPSS